MKEVVKVVSIEEIIDREQRKNNIVVYNMPESQANTHPNQTRRGYEGSHMYDMGWSSGY